MRRVEAYRANKVIYNFLKANKIQGKALLPVNICESVVKTIRYAGMETVFVDIEADTLCMDWGQSLRYSRDVDVLLYSHTYGLENDASALFDRLKENNPNLIIIDDRCLCEPFCRSEEAHLSRNVDLTVFSTGPKKQVGLLRGGFGFLENEWAYDDCHSEGLVFQNVLYQVDDMEITERKNWASAHRDELNAIYCSSLPKSIQLPFGFQNWRYNIFVPNKKEVLKAIFDIGLFASGHYEPMAQNCPVADDLYAHVINLFNDHYFSADQARQICVVINAHLS